MTFALISALLSLLLSELVLRAYFPLYISTDNVYQQNIPGLKDKVRYIRNERGLRIRGAPSREQFGKVVRVICLGGSTTEQATQNFEDTWCGILEDRMREAFPAQEIQMAAFGWGGAKSGEILQWAKSNLPELKPDIVVTLLGVNDLAFGRGRIDSPALQLRGWDPDLGYLGDFMGRLEIVKRAALLAKKISNFYMIQTNRAWEWHSVNLPELHKRRSALPLLRNPRRIQDPIHEFSANVAELLQWGSSHGFEFLVLGQPVLWRANPSQESEMRIWFPIAESQGWVAAPQEWMHREMQRYNRVQAEIAKSLMIEFIDLDPLIPKDLGYFFDDCHFTDLGSLKVANEVSKKLQLIVEVRITQLASLNAEGR